MILVIPSKLQDNFVSSVSAQKWFIGGQNEWQLNTFTHPERAFKHLLQHRSGRPEWTTVAHTYTPRKSDQTPCTQPLWKPEWTTAALIHTLRNSDQRPFTAPLWEARLNDSCTHSHTQKHHSGRPEWTTVAHTNTNMNIIENENQWVSVKICFGIIRIQMVIWIWMWIWTWISL